MNVNSWKNEHSTQLFVKFSIGQSEKKIYIKRKKNHKWKQSFCYISFAKNWEVDVCKIFFTLNIEPGINFYSLL